MAYYPFIVTRNIGGTPERIAVLYHHRNGCKSHELEEALETLTNRRLSPTRLLIVCGRGNQCAIKNRIDSLEETANDRLKVSSHIKILPYGFHGQSEPEFATDVRGNDWDVSDSDLNEIALEGLALLIEETGVILTAPRGYVFRKPSGNTSRRFVRTGNMFREPSSLAIISHLLVRAIPADIDKLYIDSFTILSGAMTYVRDRESLAIACNVEFAPPAIVNFHSYSINPGLRFPGHKRYATLISASTSGKLAEKLVDQHGANPELLFHILIISQDIGLRERSIFFKEVDPDSAAVVQPFRREISIPGEEFIASSGDPHPVKITKVHFSRLERKALKLPCYQSSLTLNLATSDHSAYSLISLSEEIGEENDAFEDWLRDEIDHSVPANVSWILAVDSQRSRALATRIQSLLAKHVGRSLPVSVLSDLGGNRNSPSEAENRTVLVVAADTGIGEELLSASRTLREFEHRHRHYLVGHLFPETAAQLERLQNNLRVSGRVRKYGWSCFLGVPLGRIECHDSWHMEATLLNRNLTSVTESSLASNLRSGLQIRSKNLTGQNLMGDRLFLPRPDLKPLKLRPESVLFREKYENISQVTVYLMVSAALQRARDHIAPDGSALDEEMCFHGSPFIVSLLDPDMFSRFNDGVIQAAFLRACAPDELNYANHKVLSRHVRDILLSAIEHHEGNAGEAIFEMLFALATKRLRLRNLHFEQMQKSLAEKPMLHEFWKLLVAEPAI